MRGEQEIRNAMLSSCKMGDASCAQGSQLEAYKYYKMAVERAQELCRQSEDLADRAESLPLMCEKLAITCYRLNYLDEAVMFYQDAIQLRLNALEALQQREDWAKLLRKRIAQDCKILAGILEKTGDENKIAECCRIGHKVSAELYNTYGTEEDARYFLVFAQRLGMSAYLSENLELAFRYFRDAVKVRSRFNDENGDRETREEFASNYEFLGHIYYKINDFQNAAECYQRKLEIYQRLAQEEPTVENYGKCAWGYYHLSTTLNDKGELNCLQNAMGIIQNIAESCPEAVPEYKPLYMNCLAKLQRFQ